MGLLNEDWDGRFFPTRRYDGDGRSRYWIEAVLEFDLDDRMAWIDVAHINSFERIA